MSDPVRLISPTRRRMYVPTVQGEPSAERVQQAVANAKLTVSLLLKAGWSVYRGPARIDALGWVVDGSDPALIPLPPATVYPKIHGKG